jgi:hypothetical protein
VIFLQTIAETCWKFLLIAGIALAGGGGDYIDGTHVLTKMVLIINVSPYQFSCNPGSIFSNGHSDLFNDVELLSTKNDFQLSNP